MQYNLADYINKDVGIYWPFNTDISCAKTLERLLKRTKPKWDLTVVKLLSLGDYVALCSQISNKERWGVLNPTKEERRILCKRQSNANNASKSSSSDDSHEETLVNLTKNMNYDGGQKFGGTCKVVKKRRSATNGSSSQKEAKNPKALKVDLAVNKNMLDDIMKLQQEGGHDLEPSDNESDTGNKGKSKEELWDIIRMNNIDMERLRTENARLRTLRCANEDLGKIKMAAREALDDLKSFKNNMRKFSEGIFREFKRLKRTTMSPSKDYHFQSPSVSMLKQKPVATTPAINNIMVTSPIISGCSDSGKSSNEVFNMSLQACRLKVQ